MRTLKAMHHLLILAASLPSIALQSPPASAPASRPVSVDFKPADGKNNVHVKDNVVTVYMPDQPIIVKFTAEGFKPETNAQFRGRSLAYGGIAKDGILNIFYDPNFPYLSSVQWREQWVKRPAYQGFSIQNIAACEFTNDAKGAFLQSFYHAHIVTKDYAFDIQATVARIEIKGQPSGPRFTREDFSKIVRSFSVEGSPDPSTLRLPPEIYAFRDESARNDSDTANWVAKECLKNPESPVVHFYQGALAARRKVHDVAGQGYGRAADLYIKKGGKSTLEMNAFLDALQGAIAHLSLAKKFREASAYCQKLLEHIKNEMGPAFKKAREEALYQLAVCYAQSAQPLKAVEALKTAVAIVPSHRGRARDDAMFAPLKTDKEFNKIIQE